VCKYKSVIGFAMVREMTMAMAMAWSFSSTPVLHHTGANCAATTAPRLLLPQTAAVLQQEDDGNGLQGTYTQIVLSSN
jgi:hypothetical protein